MTDPLTDAYLDAIEQRAHAATEGPWEASAHDHYLVICPDCGVRGGYERADAEFIAHARSDVPALLAEVRRLRAMEQRVSRVARELRYKNADTYDIVGRFLAALDGGE